jgi:hypothetical protein
MKEENPYLPHIAADSRVYAQNKLKIGHEPVETEGILQ